MANLPKISHPKYAFTIPSLKAEYEFRPFLVKEEKILLLAQETQDEAEFIRAIKQVVNNCSVIDLDIDKLALFDIEYLFLKLRGVSVDGICDVAFNDGEDDEIYKFSIPIEDIKIVDNEPDKVIEINEDLKIKMKYPVAGLTDKLTDIEDKFALLDILISSCIDTIYDSETVYDDYTQEELIEFLGTLPTAVYDKLKVFFENIPHLYYKIEYVNSKGTARQIELKTVTDFFPLG